MSIIQIYLADAEKGLYAREKEKYTNKYWYHCILTKLRILTCIKFVCICRNHTLNTSVVLEQKHISNCSEYFM